MRLSKHLTSAALAILLLAAAAPTAGAEIIFDHGNDLWAMSDNGSNQHLLVGAESVGSMSNLDNPGVDPNGTTLVFEGEWNNVCEINCRGVYSLIGGLGRRLSATPHRCANPNVDCYSADSHPTVAADGEVFFQNAYVFELGGTSALKRQSSLGGEQTEIPVACAGGGDPEQAAVNPANQGEIAYANCVFDGNPAIVIAARDGSNPQVAVYDDVKFEDVAYTGDGTHLLTDEGGETPGIWRSNVSGGEVTLEYLLAEPPGAGFASPREISGGRIAFVAQGTIWTIPSSCTWIEPTPTCTFPGNATKLTSIVGDSSLTWTSQTIVPLGGGGGGGGGGGPAAAAISGGPSAGSARASSKGVVKLKNQVVACPAGGADCKVKTSAKGSVKASASAKKKKKKTVKLGGSSYTLKAGKSGSVRLKLSKKGLKLLKKANKIKAKVVITVTTGGTKITKKVKVTLKAPNEFGALERLLKKKRG